jgi:hypothetical protein
MWLVGLKTRVKEYPKGWVVEIEQKKFTIFGIKKYWTHLKSVSGIETKPWYYSTKENAISEAVMHFHWDILGVTNGHFN